MLHWKNRSTPMPPDTGSKPAWKTQTNRMASGPVPELISGNWGQATPHWGRSWLSSWLWKTGKKTASLSDHLVRLRQSFCLNMKTRTGCWKSKTRTAKTEILLLLNVEFFFVCVFVLFPIGLSPDSTCWFLWFSFFSSFSFFLPFFLLLVLLL
jgi:hypothetical protein